MASTPQQKRSDVVLNLLAGSSAGACQVLVGQPLDTIKTRAQTAPKGQFKGPWDVAVKTLRSEGALGFYKGMASPLMGVAAVNSLLFTAFSVAKRIVSPYPDLSIAQVGMAGGIAGGVNALLASPVEMFKIRMQGQYGSPSDKKLSKVASEMWREHGFRRGIMRGFWVTFIREIPAYGSFYAGYEYTKRAFQRSYFPDHFVAISGLSRDELRPEPPQLPAWCLMTSGATGGVAYWLSSYPLDIVKSNIQLSTVPPERGYIAREFRHIVAQDGVKGLFRGLSPTLIRAVPAASCTFLAYEVSKEFLVKFGGF